MGPLPGRFLSFDAVADTYDHTRPLPLPVAEAVARLCASAAGLGSGGLFLEAGVGTGRLAAPLAVLHPGQIVGADVSLPMLRLARTKAPLPALLPVRADVQRLPFRTGSFRGALAVHLLHLLENWPLALSELRRVLLPRRGVLLLGTEQGGHSLVVDHYYALARAQGLLQPSLGAPGHARILAGLRRAGARTETLSAPGLVWRRAVPVAQTLDMLARRVYSQMWPIPDDAHAALMRDAAAYAAQMVGGPARTDTLAHTETLETRFALSAVRWPG